MKFFNVLQKKTNETKRFSRHETQGLILEGANLLLQRLMVQRNMPEKVQLISLDSSGDLCENLYVSFVRRVSQRIRNISFRQTSLGPQKINVNGKEIEAWGIQRQLIERKANALPIAWQSYLNIDG